MEDLERVLYDALEVYGEITSGSRVGTREDESPEHALVFGELGELLVQLRLQLEGAVVQANLQNARKEATRTISPVHEVVVLELRVVQSERLDVLPLNERAVYTRILAIDELNEVPERVPS